MTCLSYFCRRFLLETRSGGVQGATVSALITSSLAHVDERKGDPDWHERCDVSEASTAASDMLLTAMCPHVRPEGVPAVAEKVALSEEAEENEEEERGEAGGEREQPLRLELCEGLFFARAAEHVPEDCDDEAAEKLMRAEVAEISTRGVHRILGSRVPRRVCGDGTGLSQTTAGSSEATGITRQDDKAPLSAHESTGPEDLLVACRSALADSPKMVKLVGARLCRGRIARLVVEGGGASPASPASLACEIEHRNSTAERVSLEEAIVAVREAQRRQDAAALEAYHRQLCARRMGKDRQRLLGLA